MTSPFLLIAPRFFLFSRVTRSDVTVLASETQGGSPVAVK